jgi:hypothetical protein
MATRRPFVTSVLRGQRFSKSVPLDVLPDLTAYSDLVAAVARALFYRRNPERKRLPKGFMDRFELQVSDIGQGSSILTIERSFAGAVLFPTNDPFDEFDQARDLISQCIAYVSTGKPVPSDFPEEALPRFNGFGRRLKDTESFELKLPNQESGVVYDREVRKRLILATATMYEDAVSVFATVSGADVGTRKFRLRLDDERIVPAILNPEIEGSVLSALKDYKTARLKVSGIALLARDDRVIEFREVTEVEEADQPENVVSIRERIDQLRALEPGWMDGEGEKLSSDALDWLQLKISTLVLHHQIPAPHLYPSPDGHIEAEWSEGAWEVRADFDLLEKRVTSEAVDVTTMKARSMDSVDGDNLAEIAAFLSQFIGDRDDRQARG